MSRVALPQPVPAQLEMFRWVDRFASRDLLHVREAAAVTTLSVESIRVLLEEGTFDGMGYPLTGTKEKARRVSKAGLIRYMSRSALCSDEDRARAMAGYVNDLDARSFEYLVLLVMARRAKISDSGYRKAESGRDAR